MNFRKLSALPLIAALFAILLQSAIVFVRAEEIEVTGNGSESVNTVSAEISQTTSVVQENNASIENSVDTSADTGGNTASDNTGGSVQIETGDIIEELTIENAVNSSFVDIPCCESDFSAEISGNGEGSENTINISEENNTEIYISQNADIDNRVEGSANTGNNSANDNTGGNILIDTGSIFVTGGIKNGPVNFYNITGGSGGGDVSVRVSGNGSGSTNFINLLFGNLASLMVNNYADLDNDVTWDLNTGGNEANGNTGGDTEIRTGDIFFNLLVENGPINTGGIDWGCCDIFDPGNPPDGGGPGDGTNPPGGSSPGPSGSSSSSDGGSGGYILALAETSGEGYPMILFGLGLIAAGASLVNKKKFV